MFLLNPATGQLITVLGVGKTGIVVAGGGGSSGPVMLEGTQLIGMPSKLMAEQTQQLGLIIIYSDGTTEDVTSQATWTSSNTDYATVSSTGLLTAVAPGTATISFNYETVDSNAGGLQSIEILAAIPDFGLRFEPSDADFKKASIIYENVSGITSITDELVQRDTSLTFACMPDLLSVYFPNMTIFAGNPSVVIDYAVIFVGCPYLRTIDLPELEQINVPLVIESSDIEELSLPKLKYIRCSLIVTNNLMLTDLDLGEVMFTEDASQINLSYNALSSDSVDAILARLAASIDHLSTAVEINLNLGLNMTPSAAGFANAALITAHLTAGYLDVNHNDPGVFDILSATGLRNSRIINTNVISIGTISLLECEDLTIISFPNMVTASGISIGAD